MFNSFSCYLKVYHYLPDPKGYSFNILNNNLYELLVDISVTEVSVLNCALVGKQFANVLFILYTMTVFQQHIKNNKDTNKYEGWPEVVEMEGCIPQKQDWHGANWRAPTVTINGEAVTEQVHVNILRACSHLGVCMNILSFDIRIIYC